MRIDEKQVDGPDLERAEQQHETLLAEKREAALPELASAGVRAPARGGDVGLLASIRMILDEQELNITHLRLPQRQAIALEALQAAVTGRTTNLDTFLYAADRRSMLEQALAVLQPCLTGGDAKAMSELGAELMAMTRRVNELRACLTDREDGQDDLMAGRKVVPTKATEADATDKPKPPADPEAARPATTLTGPERPEPTKLPTTLVGADAKQETFVSTLGGPERAEPSEPATTLGDPAEIAQAAKNKPWWRRPFG